jgi:anti-anti-sigma factor
MRIDVRNERGVTILVIKGKATIGEGDVQLRDGVLQALEAGANKIVLDLAGLTTIDSSGVGELVSSYTTASNRGAKLKLANLPAKVADILQVTQLITVFDVYDNISEALDSFS